MITPSSLMKAMRRRGSSLQRTFGPSVVDVVTAFERMDTAGKGTVTLDEFVATAELAFVPEPAVKLPDATLLREVAPVPAEGAIPVPPPMTRGLFSARTVPQVHARPGTPPLIPFPSLR